MKNKVWKNDVLLILTALIWGSAFVAQRVGMDYIGPFYFNGIRFALGAVSLLPLILYRARKEKPVGHVKDYLFWGFLAGLFLFSGASLQQVGIIDTTAGNAGFITGLYVVLVPLTGIFWKHKTPLQVWIGAILALVGLYFLSIKEGFIIGKGDLYILLGALFWTGHIHVLGKSVRKVDPLILSAVQFIFCALGSLMVAFFIEDITFLSVQGALLPILYGGIMSVGVAYTLQVVAQKGAPPSHAAIILSLEGAFAALGGWILLGESFEKREIFGCVLMFLGMILAQLDFGTGTKQKGESQLIQGQP